MLKKILFISFLFSITNLISQEYEPVIKEGSYWDVSDYEGVGFCSFNHRRYQIDSDTIINNKIYKKIKKLPIQGNRFPEENPICIDPPYYVNNDNFEYLYEFVREDILEKKVYVYTDRVDNREYKEYLVCDFNLKKGDTLKNHPYVFIENIILENITITQDGRKQYNFNTNTADYTEGIGTDLGVVYPYSTSDALSSGSSLFCWGNIDNPNDCATVLSTKNFNFSSIKIYPNPVKDILTITNTENITVKILSVSGSLLKEQSSSSNITLDLSFLNSGIYILEISNLKGKKTTKILKQ